MTDQPIDPAATPDDDNAPDIAADDVGGDGPAVIGDVGKAIRGGRGRLQFV